MPPECLCCRSTDKALSKYVIRGTVLQNMVELSCYVSNKSDFVVCCWHLEQNTILKNCRVSDFTAAVASDRHTSVSITGFTWCVIYV